MKILYAATSRKGAQVQFSRLLPYLNNHIVKLAGYNRSFDNYYLDWTLDALQNITKPDKFSYSNDNLELYYNQVKKFKPDLIISDLELYTSHLGFQIGVPVWQVSPLLFYYGIDKQEKTHLYKKYPYLIDKTSITPSLKYVLANSDKKLIYSHFSCLDIELLSDYNWIQPYTPESRLSIPCQHNVCATSLSNNKKYINYLKRHDDVVLFSNNLEEKYADILMKDVYSTKEYGCNLKNSEMVITEGYMDFIADAYYAGKYVHVKPDFNEVETIINGFFVDKYHIGKCIFDQKLFDNESFVIKKDLNPHLDKLI
jgi:uncharacterized protein (TIGR00661 family)